MSKVGRRGYEGKQKHRTSTTGVLGYDLPFPCSGVGAGSKLLVGTKVREGTRFILARVAFFSKFIFKMAMPWTHIDN